MISHDRNAGRSYTLVPDRFAPKFRAELEKDGASLDRFIGTVPEPRRQFIFCRHHDTGCPAEGAYRTSSGNYYCAAAVRALKL